MAMRRRAGTIAAMAAAIVLAAAPALGSGGPEPTPLYVDPDGGSPGELTRRYAGRPGIVLPGAPSALLYLDWRLLHGLRVGEAAGLALSTPCCDAPASEWPNIGVYGWLEVRAAVRGAADSLYYVPTERAGPDYTTVPNCFRDAFDTATATLRDRASRYGAKAPAVQAWLQTQDAVFAACARTDARLPLPMADGPAWLKADRAYQEAAFALYNWRTDEAARRFEAIAGDSASPWQRLGLYLKARAIHREALARPSAAAFARSRAAIAELLDAPPGTFGRGEARPMLRALSYRDRPAKLLAKLDRELNRPDPPHDVAVALRDYLSLSEKAAAKPEAADWIATLQSAEPGPALDHALERWRETKGPAWLLAALTLVDPDDPRAGALAADAEGVKRGHPGWPTAQYHLVRLTLARADPAATRARLDALLARPELTRSERNLFSSARAQVAADLADFARFALRRPRCLAVNGDCFPADWEPGTRWFGRLGRGGEQVGLGPDAKAIIDQLPLQARIALARMTGIPPELRLDIALTGFARAVQLQDNRAIDALALMLVPLLPQLRDDWRAIAAARPGPAKRFAEFFVMAKLPGLRTDFPGYTRPQGTVANFQGYWVDWMIVPGGTARGPEEVPGSSAYVYESDWYGPSDVDIDLTCLGECGRGAFPLHLPAFAAAVQDKAAHERTHFARYPAWKPGLALPPGAVSVWDEALAYARAHPRDPRSPELLYRLIRVARWGGSHDFLGRRAFRLLHARYPGSVWAKRSPYWYG